MCAFKIKIIFLLFFVVNFESISSNWQFPTVSTSSKIIEVKTSDVDQPPHFSDLNKENNCYCGVANDVSIVGRRRRQIFNRIVGGDHSLLGEYPWQVALLSDHKIKGGHFCGGSLVSSRHVVTAAHCTADITAEELSVGLGFTNFYNDEREHQTFVIHVAEIINHPGYRGKATNYKNDISVLVLKEAMDLHKYPHIKPVCLPQSAGFQNYYNKSAIVSGWGLTNYYNGSYPEHLKDVMVTVFGNECGALSDIVGAGASQLCAGHKKGGKDACQGDSGGPLVTRDDENNMGYTLIGVVSTGSSCAKANHPGIYANVTNYIQTGWLTNIIAGAETCGPPPALTEDIIEAKERPPVHLPTENYDAVLVIGGSGYSQGRKVEVWSSHGGCSQELPELPDIRTNHESAMIDGAPILCGGDENPYSCLRLKADLTWEKAFYLKDRRTEHTMISYGPGALLFGGHYSNQVEYLHNSSSQWLGGRAPGFERSCGALTDRSSIILTGGQGTKFFTWEFDILTGDWLQRQSVPDGGRYSHACAYISRDDMHGLLITGGSNGQHLMSSTFFFDMSKGYWFRIAQADLPEPRWGAKMFNMNGDTFLLGGGDGHNYISDVYKLDFNDFTWQKLKTGLMFPRVDFSVIVLPDVCQNDADPGDQDANKIPQP